MKIPFPWALTAGEPFKFCHPRICLPPHSFSSPCMDRVTHFWFILLVLPYKFCIEIPQLSWQAFRSSAEESFDSEGRELLFSLHASNNHILSALQTQGLAFFCQKAARTNF